MGLLVFLAWGLHRLGATKPEEERVSEPARSARPRTPAARSTSSRRLTDNGTVAPSSATTSSVSSGRCSCSARSSADDHGLLDLGAAEALATRSRCARGRSPPGPDGAAAGGSREDRLALVGVRQVDEEDLVEAPLAQQLGRQRRRCRSPSRRRTPARFSCSQVRNVPNSRRLDAAVAVAARPGREALLDLVDPQHGGRDRLGDARSRGGCSSRTRRRTCRSSRPASSLSSGSCHSRATALAASDLPQPWTPTSRRPLRRVEVQRRAPRGVNATRARSSQRASAAKPPSS